MEHFTSTAIALVALNRAGETLDSGDFDPVKVINSLIELSRQRKYYDALGLLIWANAVWNGMPLLGLLGQLRLQLTDLTQLMRNTRTTEVAWLVTGLVHETVRTQDRAIALTLRSFMEVLLERYVERTCLFCHATTARFPMRIRRHIGNFADQIYSVQALSLASMVTDTDFALKIADQCAAQLVRLQGNLGQWCWHYDSREGKVLQTYPVYSVHQYGMAPMALKALAAAGGTPFKGAIRKGLEWLANNELNVNLVDVEAGTIWRNIQCNESRLKRNARYLMLLARFTNTFSFLYPLQLKVKYETWPYEWGWCLYACALSAKSQDKNRFHII
jgi:hypothetical protein